MKLVYFCVGVAAFGLAGCQTVDTATRDGDGSQTEAAAVSDDVCDPDAEIDMFAGFGGGTVLTEACIADIADKASTHPLGSKENPIRAQMPAGQRSYLARLRCSDGNPPSFERVGNFGPGIYMSIIDGYAVQCASGVPEDQILYLDMYHPGYEETRAPEGFGIDTPLIPSQSS